MYTIYFGDNCQTSGRSKLMCLTFMFSLPWEIVMQKLNPDSNLKILELISETLNSLRSMKRYCLLWFAFES